MVELLTPIVLLLYGFARGTERFLAKQNIKTATPIITPTQAIIIPTIAPADKPSEFFFELFPEIEREEGEGEGEGEEEEEEEEEEGEGEG